MWKDKCPVEKNMLFLLLLCTTFQQLRAACSSGILSVSPSGVVHAGLNQLRTFTCEVQGSGIFWYANNRHISEGDNLDLELEESITVVLDSMECARQRNLTVMATSLANNISLTCLPIGILMPSPQILLLVEGTGPVTINSSEDGYQPAVALSKLNSSLTSKEEVKNYVKLRWNQPYTSDDPHTLKYDVTIVHIETNSTVKQVEVDETELNIPAEELQHCCNYSISVGAKTENFTANVSHTNIPCSGFPPAVNTQTISTHFSWIKDMAIFTLSFTIDDIPDLLCPRQHPENVTIMALSLLTGKIVTGTSSINTSLSSQNYQVYLTGLEKRDKFIGIVLLSNQVGYSTFNDTFSFTTFAVQGLITSVEGNRIVLTCTFEEGIVDIGCHIELTHTTSGKQNVISLYKNAAPSSTTVSVQHNGLYNVSVYDIDDNGEVFPAKALTTVIWVRSSNIETAGSSATGHTPFPTSSTSPQPSMTVSPSTSQWKLWLIVLTGSIVLVVLVVSGCFLLAIFRKCTHRHKISRPSVRNTVFYCTENNYEVCTPPKV